MRKILATAAAVLGIVALPMASCSQKEPMAGGARSEITFAILSVEQAQSLETLWKPILADMEKQTGLKVKPYFSSNYTALIEAMRFDKVQAGWFSNASGLEAMRRAHGEVFAHTSYPNGQLGYHSIIIVPKDSKLTKDDLIKCNRKVDFGMGDAKSTSGTVAPLAYLFLPNHINPNTCFKNVRSASHQANIEAVAAGVLDAATNNDTALVELNNTPKGRELLSKIKVIWTSPLLPTDVIEYRANLDPVTKEKLRSFFLSYGQGTGPEADRQRANLAAVIWGPLGPDDNSHFIPERKMEATVALQQAQAKHDDAAAKTAQDELDAVARDEAAQASKTAPQAVADTSSASASK